MDRHLRRTQHIDGMSVIIVELRYKTVIQKFKIKPDISHIGTLPRKGWVEHLLIYKTSFNRSIHHIGIGRKCFTLLVTPHPTVVAQSPIGHAEFATCHKPIRKWTDELLIGKYPSHSDRREKAKPIITKELGGSIIT